MVARAALTSPLLSADNLALISMEDADSDHIPDGYSIKSLKANVALEDGFDGDPCLKIESTGKDAFARIYLPLPGITNNTEQNEYYLLVTRARIKNGASVKGHFHADKGSGGSREAGFMVWKDTDTSDWMNIRTPIALKPGSRIDQLYVSVNGKEIGDSARIGSFYLEKISREQYEKACDWKDWEMVTEQKACPEMLRGLRKGNILRNSSFEAGSTGYSYPYLVYQRITAETAYHGKHSLFCAKGYELESLYYRITPGKIYTFSACVKAKEPNTQVSLNVLSGYQWSDNIGSLAADRPGARKTINAGLEWQRFSFSFIPDYASKSCCKLWIGGGAFWLDAMQLEEGFLSDYRPDREVDVGIQRSAESKDGLYQIGESAIFNVDVFSQKEGSIALEYVLTDYYAAVVERREETVKAKAGGLRKTAQFKPAEPGIYKLVVRYRVGQVSGCSEERSFGVLPKDFTASGKSEDSYFGMHIWLNQSVPTVAKGGVKWFRAQDGLASDICANWKGIEPEPGKFNWTKGDDKVRLLRENGFQIMGTLGQTSDKIPDWAKSKEKPNQPDLEAWKKYVYEIVSHYRDRIKYWEVWNEPYYTFSSKEYADLLKTAYTEIKRADPDAKVVGVCGYLLPGFYFDWIEGILKEVGTDYLDVISHHGYLHPYFPEFASPPFEVRLEMLRTLLKKYGKKEVPIWDTETSAYGRTFYDDRLYGADTRLTRSDHASGFDKSYRDVAVWLVRQDVIGMAHGQTRCFYYGFYHVGCFSQRFVIGGPSQDEYTGAPHPMFMAQAALIREIDGARFVREINLGEKVRCYLFERDHKPTAVLWRVAGPGDARQDRITLSAGKDTLQVVNIMGGEYRDVVKNKDETIVSFSGDPVYIKAPGMKPEDLAKIISQGKIISAEVLTGQAFVIPDKENGGRLIVKIKNVSTSQQAGKIKIESAPSGWKVPVETDFPAIASQAAKITDIPVSELKGPGEILLGLSTGENKAAGKLTAGLKKVICCRPVSVAVVIDGSFDDWPQSAPITLSERDQVKEGVENWEGTADLSSDLKTCHDKNNLYFAIRVTDQKTIVDKGDSQSERVFSALWRADCVELFFAPKLMQSFTPEIYQLMFAPASKEQGLPAAYYSCWQPGLKGVEIASRERPGIGYDLEIKVPLTVFAPANAEDMIGFDVNVNDRDKTDGNRKSVIIWNGTIKNTTDSKNYGVLVLE